MRGCPLDVEGDRSGLACVAEKPPCSLPFAGCQVDYFGAMTPLKSMSNVSTPDAQTVRAARPARLAHRHLQTAATSVLFPFHPIRSPKLTTIDQGVAALS